MPTDPHTEPLRVTERDGLCLPDAFIGYEGGLVVRTPRHGTTVMPGRTFGGTLAEVKPRHFGEIDRTRTNGYLAPDRVSLKKYGEAEQVFRVAVADAGGA